MENAETGFIVTEHQLADETKAPCTISADGRQLIFTSCIGRRGYGSCDLFESKKSGKNGPNH